MGRLTQNRAHSASRYPQQAYARATRLRGQVIAKSGPRYHPPGWAEVLDDTGLFEGRPSGLKAVAGAEWQCERTDEGLAWLRSMLSRYNPNEAEELSGKRPENRSDGTRILLTY